MIDGDWGRVNVNLPGCIDLDLSGASTALVGKTLRVNASGGSTLRYGGTPELCSNISGGSTVKPD